MFILQISKYIAPSDMPVLWITLTVAAAGAFLRLRYKYRRYKANPLRIRKKIRFSGGLKMSATVRNVSSSIVEIDTPVVEFRQPRMRRRRFKIVTPGSRDIFPLGMAPQTSYDFFVEFTPLYEREPVLRKYGRIIILIRNREGKVISSKKAKLPLGMINK
jgi:hypothetical protein